MSVVRVLLPLKIRLPWSRVRRAEAVFIYHPRRRNFKGIRRGYSVTFITSFSEVGSSARAGVVVVRIKSYYGLLTECVCNVYLNLNWLNKFCQFIKWNFRTYTRDKS